jgi:GTP-binding protein
VSVADPLTPDKFTVLADLEQHGDQILVAKGGRGGYGNAHFKSSTRQAPDFAELGEPGEHKILKFDLKLVADIGVIGYPSVGKSTLISVVSGARPKIADYPFTTLVPNLGVVHVFDRSFVICDVPGLIEGASEGKGLGHQFLRHIERCGALIHMLDASRAFPPGAMSDAELDPELLVHDYKAIRKELEAYSPTLAKKRELVVLNKADLLQDIAPIEKALKKAKIKLFATISAATKRGTAELMEALLPVVLEERENREKAQEDFAEGEAKKIPVIKPQETSIKMGAYKVQTLKDHSLLVTGKRLEQFTVMTDFHSTGAFKRFLDVLDRIGLHKVIKKHMSEHDTPVYIGKTRVDQHL